MDATKQRTRASASRRRANRSRSQPPAKRSRAKPVIPGTNVLVTRRTIGRTLFLNPDAKNAERLCNFIGYTLGICLERYGLDLHAACFPGNHEHINATDHLGNLPAFKDTFHAWLARGVNAMRGRFGKFWDGGESVDVHCGDDIFDDELGERPDSDFDALVYTLCQVSKHGLLPNGSRYAGFSTYDWRFNETRTFKRPDWFYDPTNPEMPNEVSITLKRPKGKRPDLNDDEFYDEMVKRVRAKEIHHKAEHRKAGRRYLGEEKIAKANWNRAPRSKEDHFVAVKRIRGRDNAARRAAIKRSQTWRARYADARNRLRAGETDVEFPYGTYWMRRFSGVKVAKPPP